MTLKSAELTVNGWLVAFRSRKTHTGVFLGIFAIDDPT